MFHHYYTVFRKKKCILADCEIRQYAFGIMDYSLIFSHAETLCPGI